MVRKTDRGDRTGRNSNFRKEIARGGIFKITKAELLKKIKERIKSKSDTEVRDVCRLTHCYLLTCVFARKTNTGMSWHVSEFVEDIDNMCLYDWSSYIVNVLVEQMGKSQSMTSGGCAMLLPVRIFSTCVHGDFLLKTEDGRKFIAFMFGLSVQLAKEVFAMIKSQILFGRKSMCEAYGEILFRVWKVVDGECKDEMENRILMGLFEGAIYAGSGALAASIRRVLGALGAYRWSHSV